MTSGTDLVTVNSALEPGAVTPASPVIDKGQSVTLTANPLGGTAPYSYQWYAGSSSTCSSDAVVSGATSSTYQVSPVSGTYYCYTVTDASTNAPTVASSTDLVIVNSALVAGAVSPASPVLDSGQSVTLTVNASEGTVPYSYQWYAGASSICSADKAIGGATSATFVASPTTSTYYCYKVTDGSTNAPTVLSPTDLVTVNPALEAAAITPTSPSIDTGQSVTLTANPSGGTAPYSYQWYAGSSATCSSDTAISGATDASYVVSPTSATYYCYSVTDNATVKVNVSSVAGLVTVNAALTAGAVTPTAPTVVQGESVTLTANPAGGTPPYSYEWYAGSSATCSSDVAITGATSSTYKATPTSGTYYCYKVTDSSVGTPSESALSATVLPVVLPPSKHLFLGLPAAEGYAVLGACIAAALVVIVLLALLIRRRRRAATSPVPWTPEEGAPPPAAEEPTPPPPPPEAPLPPVSEEPAPWEIPEPEPTEGPTPPPPEEPPADEGSGTGG
jgi:hypothetical protein